MILSIKCNRYYLVCIFTNICLCTDEGVQLIGVQQVLSEITLLIQFDRVLTLNIINTCCFYIINCSNQLICISYVTYLSRSMQLKTICTYSECNLCTVDILDSCNTIFTSTEEILEISNALIEIQLTILIIEWSIQITYEQALTCISLVFIRSLYIQLSILLSGVPILSVVVSIFTSRNLALSLPNIVCLLDALNLRLQNYDYRVCCICFSVLEYDFVRNLFASVLPQGIVRDSPLIKERLTAFCICLRNILYCTNISLYMCTICKVWISLMELVLAHAKLVVQLYVNLLDCSF